MAEEKRVKSTGSGSIKRPSAWNRFKGNFMQEDRDIIENKIIDSIANVVKRIISDTVDIILYGDTTNKTFTSFNSSGKVGSTFISYNSMFNGGKKKTPLIEDRTFNTQEIGQIMVPSKEEAEKCIAQMMDVENNYGNVRVGDLYDYFGESAPSTLVSYGWHDFASTRVKPLPNGSWLIIPPVLELLQTK